MKHKKLIISLCFGLFVTSLAFVAQAQTPQDWKSMGERPEFASGTMQARFASSTRAHFGEGRGGPRFASSTHFASSTKDGRPFKGEFASSTNPVFLGKVLSIDSSSFTIESVERGSKATTTYTVAITNSTAFSKGTTTASVSDVSAGLRVLVKGTLSSGTITATHVDVLPAGNFNESFPGDMQRNASSTTENHGFLKKVGDGIGNIFKGMFGWFK